MSSPLQVQWIIAQRNLIVARREARESIYRRLDEAAQRARDAEAARDADAHAYDEYEKLWRERIDSYDYRVKPFELEAERLLRAVQAQALAGNELLRQIAEKTEAAHERWRQLLGGSFED